MKQTSLHQTHCETGATMVPYAGWDMPVSYTGTVAEVDAVRSNAGIFDVSHMGEVMVKGPGAAAFLQNLSTNDIGRLAPGLAQYSMMLNPDGGVIDDIIVYNIGVDEFLVVINAGCKDKDWDWIRQQAAQCSGVTVVDESDQWGLLAIQGPAAVGIANNLTDSRAVSELARFGLRRDVVAGIPCIVARTGYTGEDGVELFCPWDKAPELWNAVVAAGVTPAGLGARDVLRLEAAYPLYGHELQANVSPLESGVGWAVRTKKGPFIGRDAVLARKKQGTETKLVGLRMTERAIPRDGYVVTEPEGHGHSAGGQIGVVTSGTYSPTLKGGIALARLHVDHSEVDTIVVVDIRGRKAHAAVVELPFYRNGV